MLSVGNKYFVTGINREFGRFLTVEIPVYTEIKKPPSLAGLLLNFYKSYLIMLAGVSQCLGGRGQKNKEYHARVQHSQFSVSICKINNIGPEASNPRRGQHYFSKYH